MILFFQKSEKEPYLTFPINGYKNLIIRNVTSDQQPTFEEIYISSTNEFNSHFSFLQKTKPEISLFQVDEKNIIMDTSFPCMIGMINSSNLFRKDLNTIDVLETLYKEKKSKISVVFYSENRFAIGDSLIQAAVYKDLYNQAKEKGIDCDFINYTSLSTQIISENYSSIFPELKIRYLPVNLNNLRCADLVLTDSGFAANFADDMHDSVAQQLCFKLSDSFSVENTLNYDVNIYNKAKGIYSSFNNKNPILVFNKESNSILRDMDKSFADELINTLLETNKFNIVSFDRKNILDIKHPNYKLLTKYTSELTDYYAFLAASDGLISVDSGPIHVAARLGIPSFGMYTSINPKIREKYYKNATSILIDNRYLNNHFINDLTNDDVREIWSNVDKKTLIKKIIKKFKKSVF